MAFVGSVLQRKTAIDQILLDHLQVFIFLRQPQVGLLALPFIAVPPQFVLMPVGIERCPRRLRSMTEPTATTAQSWQRAMTCCPACQVLTCPPTQRSLPGAMPCQQC